MEVRHDWLASSPHEGFEQLRLKSRPKEPSPSLPRVGANFYSSVKQQDFSASVWLRRKDHLEQSQQKCIVIFALVCCFAILVALIFSAVDIMGEDEDGLTEKNCQNNCRVALVENIPEGVNYSDSAPSHLSLFQGWMNLLNIAEKSVDIVSSQWDLHHNHPSACQGQRLFEKLLELASQNIEIKLVSDILPTESKVLNDLKTKGAEVLYMNMTAYNEGRLQSSFWIVDKQHVYIGSASLDWRSLGQMKELGVIVYNCSCLVLDLQRIFALYSSLKYKNKVPPSWSKRLYGVYDTQHKLMLQLNETKSELFVSNSPKLFCPKDRVLDIEAIYNVIDGAKQFVYIAVMDYLPIVNDANAKRYWPYLDGKIREALVLRNIKVRLLISFSKDTDPLTFNFVSSLKAICTEVPSCSLKVKFFDLEEENVCFLKEQKNTSLPKLNRNKYMVTDGAAYIGNFDWVGNDFTQNAGAGLVINQAEVGNNTSIIKQLKAVFERDWYSHYAKSLQPTKIPTCLNHKLNKAVANKTAMN
ncbi:inactive phospholipase D5 isoform X2 [Pelodiscus sinensis]|uniref:Phospholipase D family member 5 n=2 Tax=Pelodiscus sinensis TaxID=13735 RepID=K7FB68_PELSI|nr:inactive phospholipase D5 isoform X3 [Pelodiscus sinensis]|eukprot:XP_006135250.1 inactive phospholipase D5 isoform X3 [Pelodiscus sinensis]